MLGEAYSEIIRKDKWDNHENAWEDEPVLRYDRIEEHELYMSIAKEIEKLL